MKYNTAPKNPESQPTSWSDLVILRQQQFAESVNAATPSKEEFPLNIIRDQKIPRELTDYPWEVFREAAIALYPHRKQEICRLPKPDVYVGLFEPRLKDDSFYPKGLIPKTIQPENIYYFKSGITRLNEHWTNVMAFEILQRMYEKLRIPEIISSIIPTPHIWDLPKNTGTDLAPLDLRYQMLTGDLSSLFPEYNDAICALATPISRTNISNRNRISWLTQVNKELTYSRGAFLLSHPGVIWLSAHKILKDPLRTLPTMIHEFTHYLTTGYGHSGILPLSYLDFFSKQDSANQ